MNRNIDEKIEKWLRESNKALLLYGARQVGKTYAIRKILNRNKISFFEVNFYEDPDFLKTIKNCSSTQELIHTIEILSPIPLKKNETVIFFDEVQLYPEIITKIKFLVEEGSYRFVLSGSLLGVELNGLKSMPVGYVEMLRMYPMDFYEFSIALGVQQKTWNYLRDCYFSKQPILETIHKDMMRVFSYYLVVGGMPDVVKSFILSKNLNDIYELQRNLINQYKVDFSKYEEKDRKLKLIAIYDNIPSQLNKQDNRFVFSYLNKELKFDRYENSFLWLKDSGVALPVYISQQLKKPLEVSKEKNTFKLFLSDVGLLTSCFPLAVRKAIALNEYNTGINEGSLYENFVAQELCSHDLIPYYYKSKKIGEIDFLIEIENDILALEIKSGKDYRKHNALNHLIKVEEKDEKFQYCVFSNYNIEVNGEITNYPIYMIDFVKRPVLEDGKIDVDLGSL